MGGLPSSCFLFSPMFFNSYKLKRLQLCFLLVLYVCMYICHVVFVYAMCVYAVLCVLCVCRVECIPCCVYAVLSVCRVECMPCCVYVVLCVSHMHIHNHSQCPLGLSACVMCMVLLACSQQP